MRLILLAFLVFVVGCKDTQVDTDAGLYDPLPPAGSAFVRFINMQGEKATPSAKGKKYKKLNNKKVSSYYVVPQGKVEVSVGSEKIVTNIAEGRFYTVIGDEGVFVLEDKANKDRSKATIAAYNLSDLDEISLKANKGKIEVLERISSKSVGSRDINAVKIDFSLFRNGDEIFSFEEEIIERGNHYSIIYDGEEARMVTATTNTRQ